MATRDSHLPNVFERSALQKLLGGERMGARIGSSTIVEKLIMKGWIEPGSANRIFRITAAGEAALRTKLPLNKGGRAALDAR
jgi:hypothetical protein